MTERDDRPRLYGEVEVARIFERATEIHSADSRAGPRGSGLSLAELEEIAREAGIPVASLRQAAHELDQVGQGAPGGEMGWLAGESPTILLERTVPVELPPEACERLIAEIQRVTGSHGQGGLLGRTLTWQSDTPSRSRSLQVVVTSGAEHTRIRIEERLHQLAGQLFGGLVGGVGGGAGVGLGLGLGIALQSTLFAVAWPLGVLGGTYLAARGIFSSKARTRQRELGRLLDVLAETVAETGVRSGTSDRSAGDRALSEAPAPGDSKNAGSS